MSQTLPAALVRLREADVVRLCGLQATARGMELAARHAVSGGRRDGARLDALVADGELHRRAWIALPDDLSIGAAAWSCACLDPTAQSDAAGLAVPARLGCEHIAAILSAWIRAPTDFRGGETELSEQAPATVAEPTPISAQLRLKQPALLPSPLSRASLGASLADELARLSSPEVLALARRVLEAEPDEREVRGVLAAVLRDPARLASLVARLDHDAQTLLGEILLLGGSLTTADLESMYARASRPLSAARADVGVLARHGLIFPVTGRQSVSREVAERSWKEVTGWRVPPEIRAALARTLPIEPLMAIGLHGPPALMPHAAERAADSAQGEQAAQREQAAQAAQAKHLRVLRATPRPLCLALALLARAPRPVGVSHDSTRDGMQTNAAKSVPPAVQTLPGPILSAGDLPPRQMAEFARAAGVAPGLARMARRLLLWAGEAGTHAPLCDLAVVPPEERAQVLRAGFRLWASAETASELADLAEPGAPVIVRFDRAHPAWRPAALAAEALAARTFVLRLVKGACVGCWYALDDLLNLVWRIQPDFLRGRQRTYASPAWWLERPGERRPLRPSVHAEWLAAEGEYLRALLTGPLVWWGALDLAVAKPEGAAVAIRLTPLGEFLLSRHESSPEPPSAAALMENWGPALLPTRDGALAVQPLSADAALLATLEVWARPHQVAGGRLIYRVDANRACAAFDRNTSLDGLSAQLRRHQTPGDTRLEARFIGQLSAWRQVYGRTRIEHDWALLEARDEAALREALAYVPEIASRCRLLGQGLALVPESDAETLRTALGKRGYAL